VPLVFQSRISPRRWLLPGLVFVQDKTVFALAIGESIGNAVTQMACALGAKHAMSSTTNHAKAEQAKALGFDEVIDTSLEKLADGVRRITAGYGADIVIDGIGGEVLSEALGALAFEGSLTTLGYSASRQTTFDVTKLIVPQASIRSLNMFTQPKAVVSEAWTVVVSLLNPVRSNRSWQSFFRCPMRLKRCVIWLRTGLSAGSSSPSDNLGRKAMERGTPWVNYGEKPQLLPAAPRA
jgi:NADPH:quinone reductase-like Zn-dependent oxidoreductase